MSLDFETHRRDAFLGLLQAAVAAEMAQVTEVSMDMFLANRDYHTTLIREAENRSQRRREIYEKARSKDRELSPAEQADVDRLATEGDALYKKAESMPSMWIHHYGDELLYGGKHCAKTFSSLAVTLAHMAHNLGGVNFAGLHWCAGSGHMGTNDRYPCKAEIRREQEAVA